MTDAPEERFTDDEARQLLTAVIRAIHGIPEDEELAPELAARIDATIARRPS